MRTGPLQIALNVIRLRGLKVQAPHCAFSHKPLVLCILILLLIICHAVHIELDEIEEYG